MIGRIPVLRAPHIPLSRIDEHGVEKQILCVTMRRPRTDALAMFPMPWFEQTDHRGRPVAPPRPAPIPTETVILVHPDRYDAFVMAINQPDIFDHPEVRALLLGLPRTANTADLFDLEPVAARPAPSGQVP